MIRTLVAVLGTLIAVSATIADGTLISWGADDLEGMSDRRWKRATQRSSAEVLALNKSASTWPEAYEVLLGANEHREDRQFLTKLAAQVVESHPTALTKTSKLIIWERISSGQIRFEGRGYQVNDDLFALGGRANWVLRSITQKTFGYITPSSTRDDIEVIRGSWDAYISGDEPEQYQHAHTSEVEGLEELRSLAAVEALVVSLSPNGAKERVTNDCLRRVYGLDSLPSDPHSFAHMCDPDVYAKTYLSKITDVPDLHSYEWWADWWQAHKGALRWNSTTARFEVDPASGLTQP